jgi:hypothetical protein
MAGTGSVTINGQVSNLQTGSRTLGPITISSSPATELNLANVQTLVLASGANTITIPSSTAVGVVINFAPASTQTKTLKGVTGDTGIAVTRNGTCFLAFDQTSGAPANFVVTAGGVDTGNVTEFWFI